MSRDLYLASKAWPFEEARKVLSRIGGRTPAKGHVLFETGYGPSGLPHIGTFGEVARTSMVRHAFHQISDTPTRLICFSDDMDGLRRAPENVPNTQMLLQHLKKPLTDVPDPFGQHSSFGAHNNARLRAFLDAFGFKYEFLSATEMYRSGKFDAALLKVLENYEAVINVVLPELGEERRKTYSPFLPICARTGRVLEAPVVEVRPKSGTIVYRDEDGSLVETPVTGGRCKLQWRADWAMRWTALDVDYEMSGKDLISSVQMGSKICRAIGGRPPETLSYELFLDENGERISKSRGNGLTIDEWLRYASPESLQLFMFQKPRTAKRLHFDVIPKAVDEYIAHLEAYPRQSEAERIANPVWHIHNGAPPEEETPLSFSMLLNLAAASNSSGSDVLWGYIARYLPGIEPAVHPILDRMVNYAVAYYHDFVLPAKNYRPPTEQEKIALADLRDRLAAAGEGSSAESLQEIVYETGKTHGFANLRDWFKALYEILLGQSQGPRMGPFIALYGVGETCKLIARVLAGENPGGKA
ncbi:MAG: lysine--tRNA ligase [Pseudomonadota bacterium]